MSSVVVHTRPDCRSCDLAKAWLHARGIPFQVVLHDDVVEWSLFKANEGVPSAPAIYVDGGLLGGFQELSQYGEALLLGLSGRSVDPYPVQPMDEPG